MNAKARLATRGVTLTEICAVLAIASILVGMAVPSFQDALQRRELDGRASEFRTDMHYLRSEAVSRNHSLLVSFQSVGAGCYIVHTGKVGDCTCRNDGVAQCQAGATALKTVHLHPSGRTSMQANVSYIRLDPLHGTATPGGTIRFVDRKGREIRHVVNMAGRIRSCSPGAAMPGYRSCIPS
jgi:type IV fimbrial biogenesis protein FimT